MMADGEGLNLEELNEESVLAVTSINRGRITLAEKIRQEIGVDKNSDKQVLLFVHNAENKVFGGKVVDEIDLLEMVR